MTRIRALLGFSKTPAPDIRSRGNAVLGGMAGNPAFPDPPVAMTVFKEALDRFAEANAEALDGSRTAIAAMREQREVIIKMLRSLGHYAEDNCNNDMAIFASSGFEVASTTRVPSQPLPQPKILKLDQGNTGQLLVKIRAVLKARHYELRYAALGPGAIPGPWATETLTGVKAGVLVNNLTPGSTYAFQVRAYGTLGYTDWSDSVTRICI